MSITRAAVGNILRDFEDTATHAQEVWRFVRDKLVGADEERPIVLMNSGGDTFGLIWDTSLFQALWETPEKMANYLFMAGFDREDE